MSGTVQIKKTGPHTYSPKSGQVVRGGRVVEATTDPGRIQEAGAGSLKALGVALTDAIAPEGVVTAPTTGGDGRPTTAFYSAPTVVAVADSGIHVRVTYAADAAFGVALICAANGTVTPAGATPDARTIVGWCREPAGVVVATKATGIMKTV